MCPTVDDKLALSASRRTHQILCIIVLHRCHDCLTLYLRGRRGQTLGAGAHALGGGGAGLRPQQRLAQVVGVEAKPRTPAHAGAHTQPVFAVPT